MEKQMVDDLIEIFDEEYEKRRLITPQNTAEKMTAKGYRKQSDVVGANSATPTGEWISVEERLPEPEVEVFISAIRKRAGIEYPIITTAMYEDGTVSTDESEWNWNDLDFHYDEENDRTLIPEGWWEYRHYNPEDTYCGPVDDKVTHWMPLPEPPKGV